MSFDASLSDKESDVVETKETGRIEAFSDGVFAIATTLLILEIKVPTLNENGQTIETGKQLIQGLLNEWPSYLAYLTGFLSIVVMWLNHHRLFTLIKRSTHGLMLLNALLLLMVTTIPFPTALLAHYIDSPNVELANVSVLVYAGVLFVLAIAYNILWRYVSHNGRLMDRNADPLAIASITRSYNVGLVLYATALAIAFFNALISVIIFIFLTIFFALPGAKTVDTEQSPPPQGPGL
ncbi:MAG TPA: TMEM175 family protein [Chloroflexia bacterium]|nr:TMEM175 family protein [Chloroflexia bacterium]